MACAACFLACLLQRDAVLDLELRVAVGLGLGLGVVAVDGDMELLLREEGEGSPPAGCGRPREEGEGSVPGYTWWYGWWWGQWYEAWADALRRCSNPACIPGPPIPLVPGSENKTLLHRFPCFGQGTLSLDEELANELPL